MKHLYCIQLLLFIGGWYRSLAIINEPPEDCSRCWFKDTSTLPQVHQCWLKNKLNKGDMQFLRMIECGMRTHCRIADPCRRVRSIESSTNKTFEKTEYDFIIVGAGVAGPVLARRLSENPNHTVLLLEAGPEEPIGPSSPYFFSSAVNTSLDWKFETQPQKNACLVDGGVCYWPRGKMIGGTFIMSGMMYTRGSPEIYNNWSQQGSTGWNYTEVLEYFIKSENNKQNKSMIDSKFHGFNGPMPVDNFPHLPKVAEMMLQAAQEIGFKMNDPNGKTRTGIFPAAVMIDKGIRASPSRMYLRPVLDHANLQVFIESYVTKIIFKGNRATGVQFVDKFNVTHTVSATKEIILSGGTIGSAQLLLLSGIGPKKHLEDLRIPVIKDLPVGFNVHHHVGVEGTATFHNITEKDFSLESLENYLNDQTGPFSSTGLTQVSGFWNSSKGSHSIPDVQFFLDPYCSREQCRKFNKGWNNVTVTGMRSIYLLTNCTGTIKLRSANPFDKPIIDPNYLCDQRDVDATVEGIRKLQQILKATTFKKFYARFGAANEDSCKEHTPDSDQYWKCQVRTNTLGENHHAGSCKMGSLNDTTTVVDPQLLVKGIQNLRVIDASIMPTPINCNTIAPVIMIAEKGADMIVKKWPR